MNPIQTQQLQKLQTKLKQAQNDGFFIEMLVTAKMGVISTKVKKTLVPFEDMRYKFFVASWDEFTAYTTWNKPPVRFSDNVRDTIKKGYKDSIIQRLRTDTAFKRSVGGTKWEVVIADDYFHLERHLFDQYNGEHPYRLEGITPDGKLHQVFMKHQDYVLIEDPVVN